MTLRITEAMVSDLTDHYAEHTSVAEDQWRVSWYPSLVLDRNRTITAMTLAETFATHPDLDERTWAQVQAWANELGLDGWFVGWVLGGR